MKLVEISLTTEQLLGTLGIESSECWHPCLLGTGTALSLGTRGTSAQAPSARSQLLTLKFELSVWSTFLVLLSLRNGFALD